MVAIDSRLRELREHYHYTQEYISSQLNIERPAYSNYECGKRMPPIELLVRLSDFYRISMDELLCSPALSDSTLTDEYPFLLTNRDERVLIRLYRLLPDDTKREALQFLQFKLRASKPA